MDLQFQPAHTFSIEQLVALFNEAFPGYIGGEFRFTPTTFARFLSRDDVDLDFSQVFLRDALPVGFGYVARQGWTSRLAAFGVIASASGQGVGKAAMSQMIAQAKERGDRVYLLEVIEQNTRAVKLYQGVGFEIMRRLVGYAVENPTMQSIAGEAARLNEIDVYEAARVVVQHGASLGSIY